GRWPPPTWCWPGRCRMASEPLTPETLAEYRRLYERRNDSAADYERLADPAPSIVGELLDEVDRLRGEVWDLHRAIGRAYPWHSKMTQGHPSTCGCCDCECIRLCWGPTPWSEPQPLSPPRDRILPEHRPGRTP